MSEPGYEDDMAHEKAPRASSASLSVILEADNPTYTPEPATVPPDSPISPQNSVNVEPSQRSHPSLLPRNFSRLQCRTKVASSDSSSPPLAPNSGHSQPRSSHGINLLTLLHGEQARQITGPLGSPGEDAPLVWGSMQRGTGDAFTDAGRTSKRERLSIRGYALEQHFRAMRNTPTFAFSGEQELCASALDLQRLQES